MTFATDMRLGYDINNIVSDNATGANSYMSKVWIKSGEFMTSQGIADGELANSYYICSFNTGNTGKRYLEMEGGILYATIAGGRDKDLNGVKNSVDYINTMIRIKGGEVKGSIFGSAKNAAAQGSRQIIMTGGTVRGWIAGGCNGTNATAGETYGASYIYIGGNARVDSEGSTTSIGASIGGNVYGAGCGYSSTSTSGKMMYGTNVVMADNAYVERGVYGGGSLGYCETDQTAYVYVTGGHVKGKSGNYTDRAGVTTNNVIGGVFGGARMRDGGYVKMYMTGGLIESGLFGGSNYTGTIAKNVTMQINGGQVGTSTTPANIHGGGYGASTIVSGNVDVTLGTKIGESDVTYTTSGSAVIYGDVYGGSALGKVNGTSANGSWHTNVTLNAGTIHGSLYGGALGSSTTAANVYGPVQVTVNGGSVMKTDENGANGSGAVYGANNINGAPQRAVTVDIYGTNSAPAEGEYALFSVYGGGNKADYTPDDDELWPEVTIHNCNNSIEYVYGGGNAAAVNSTSVTIYGGNKIGNVFGGGNGISGTAADVYGDTYLMIYGGTIGNIFGGSNAAGTIDGDINVNIFPSGEDGGTPCPMEIDNVYGGGNMAPSQAGKIAISCGDNLTYDFHIGNVYGGANAADIDGDIQLDITAGKIDNVFGGNNTSGAISGIITVNIEEAEPSCGMAIGNVYGGGNKAAYTAPTGTKDYPEVNIIKGTVLHDVFGGGLGSSALVTGNPQVNMTGGLVGGTLYGGGSAAPVTGNPHVKMNVSTHSGTGEAKSDTWWDVKGYVFGGGLGESAKVTGSTKVEILGTSRVGKNVYGGGNGGAVTGNTDVTIGQ